MAELGHLRGDHHPAVALERILLKIFLVVIFGDVKPVEGGHLGDDRGIPNPGCSDLPDDFFGHFLLLLVVIKNRRAVLCADIIPLAVEGGRVVNRKEDLDQLIREIKQMKKGTWYFIPKRSK